MKPIQPLKTMRDVLIEGIYERMKKNDKIFFLSADFGAPALDKLRKNFKDRFINVGIAEQNLINIAVGLALENYKVFAFAIAPFITMRAYEQIRQNLSLIGQEKRLNVNLVGVGTGLSYDIAGPSHHCLEDITLMRLLPNLTIFSPSDGKLVEKFIDFAVNNKTPKYLRFDGKPLPLIYDSVKNIKLKQGFYELIRGRKICLVSTGIMTHIALDVAKELGDIGVVDIFIIKPIDEKLLLQTIKRYEYIITLEEGFINKGGLDSLISNIISNYNSPLRLKRLGFADKHVFETGNRSYLHKLNNMDKESVIKLIKGIKK